MSGSDLTEGVENIPPSAAWGGKSPVLLGLRPEVASFDKRHWKSTFKIYEQLLKNATPKASYQASLVRLPRSHE